MTITEFLLDMIAADELLSGPHTVVVSGGRPIPEVPNCVECGWKIHGEGHGWWQTDETRAIMTAHERTHPDRTQRRARAECAAKRTIIELHKNESWNIPINQDPHVEYIISSDSDAVTVITDGVRTGHIPVPEYLERVGATKNPPAKELRALAAIYENHPNYQQEWKL